MGLLARDGARRGGAARKLELKWSTFVSPCLVASLLAIVLALTGWKLPQVLTDTVATIGNITTPGALLVIGISIAKQPLRRVLGSPQNLRPGRPAAGGIAGAALAGPALVYRRPGGAGGHCGGFRHAHGHHGQHAGRGSTAAMREAAVQGGCSSPPCSAWSPSRC